MCLHGRLLALAQGQGWLADGTGMVGFSNAEQGQQVRPGDVVEVFGSVQSGKLWVERLELLAPAQRSPWAEGSDGQGFARDEGRRRQNLVLRSKVVRAIRGFFQALGFLEVETPALVQAPGSEAHLEPFRTRPGGRDATARYLITSPEHHMKRLLGSGLERIFQICRCFRDGEVSATHNPEFTMVEWYRAYASYEEIMADAEELVVEVCRAVRGEPGVSWQGQAISCQPPWRRLTVRQAFADFAGVELRSCASAAVFARQARERGCGSVAPLDTWEDVFYKLLLEKVEPALAGLGPVFLTEYPASMAALAKLKEDDPAVAERAEVYLAGLELANGFTELNNPVEQRRRFADEARKRRGLGLPDLPEDEEFLATMERGIPPAGGMALGVDRLAMLVGDVPAIDGVLAFPSTV